jgi:hypothetical protein
MTADILIIKGRAGDYQYGRLAPSRYGVRDRRTGAFIETAHPIQNLNDASRLARRLHEQAHEDRCVAAYVAEGLGEI